VESGALTEGRVGNPTFPRQKRRKGEKTRRKITDRARMCGKAIPTKRGNIKLLTKEEGGGKMWSSSGGGTLKRNEKIGEAYHPSRNVIAQVGKGRKVGQQSEEVSSFHGKVGAVVCGGTENGIR